MSVRGTGEGGGGAIHQDSSGPQVEIGGKSAPRQGVCVVWREGGVLAAAVRCRFTWFDRRWCYEGKL